MKKAGFFIVLFIGFTIIQSPAFAITEFENEPGISQLPDETVRSYTDIYTVSRHGIPVAGWFTVGALLVIVGALGIISSLGILTVPGIIAIVIGDTVFIYGFSPRTAAWIWLVWSSIILSIAAFAAILQIARGLSSF